MGCWAETCAITSTPIFENERVVMIVLDEEWLRRILADTRTITEGSPVRWKVVKAILRGVYNDYGWLKGVDKMPTDSIGHLPPCMFFHEEIWDWLLTLDLEPWQRIDNYLETGSLFHDSVNVTPELKDFIKICIHASNLRRDVLSGVKFQGHQESIGYQMKMDLNTKQREILERHHKWNDEDDLEEGE